MGWGDPEGGCWGVESSKVDDGVWRARRWVMGCGELESV